MTFSRSVLYPALLGCCAVLLVGCIPVKDVTQAWEDGSADEDLRGQWAVAGNPDQNVGFETTDGQYLITSSSDGLEGGVRTVEVGEHKYLVVVSLRAAIRGFDKIDDDVKSGNLLRYELDGDTLTIYQYDDDALGNAIDNGDVKGENSEDDSPTLETVDDPALQWLAEIAEQDAGWTATVYQRED